MFFGRKRIKTVCISVNTSEVKYEKNETNDEGPSVTDSSVINDPRYFRLFEFGKNILNKIDSTCEQACMANLKGNYETEFLKYQ